MIFFSASVSAEIWNSDFRGIKFFCHKEGAETEGEGGEEREGEEDEASEEEVLV